MKSNKWFWSIHPLQNKKYKSFKDLKHFKRSDAIQITSSFIAGWIASLFALVIGVIPENLGGSLSDPWTRAFILGSDSFFPIASSFLFILTSLIAWKQWGYYYDIDGGGKQGVFVKEIKWVNYIDRTLDYLLVFLGGALFFMSIFPVMWFAAFFCYSILVFLRSLTTLLRKKFAYHLRKKGVVVKDWYFTTLDHSYNGKKVKTILSGWVVTMFIVAVYNLIIFILLYSDYTRILDHNYIFFYFILIGEIFFFFFTRHWTYRLCKKINEKLN